MNAVPPAAPPVVTPESTGVQSTWALLLFGALKTGADVLMHYFEHRILQRSAPAAVATGT